MRRAVERSRGVVLALAVALLGSAARAEAPSPSPMTPTEQSAPSSQPPPSQQPPSQQQPPPSPSPPPSPPSLSLLDPRLDPALLEERGHRHVVLGWWLTLVGSAVSLASAVVTVEAFARCGAFWGNACAAPESYLDAGLTTVAEMLTATGLPYLIAGQQEQGTAAALRARGPSVRLLPTPTGARVALTF